MLSGCSEPAPSSVRPVFARKTSSRLGACSWRCSTWRSAASSARTMSARPNSSPRQPHGERLRRHLRELAELLEDPRQLRALLRIGGNRLHRRVRDLRLQLGGRALGDDPPVVDDADAVREHVGLLEVLRREEDRDAVLLRETSDLGPERGAGLRIEPGRRLVEEEDARVGARARARGRGAASSLPSTCAPCARLPPRGPRARGARRIAGCARPSRCRAAPSGAAGARGP